MTREELKEHCQRQIQQFERVEKIMPVTPNDWKRYEEHKLILELLEQGSILEKIKAEIEDTGAYEQEVHGKTEFLKGITYCLNIIDKHLEELKGSD